MKIEKEHFFQAGNYTGEFGASQEIPIIQENQKKYEMYFQP